MPLYKVIDGTIALPVKDQKQRLRAKVGDTVELTKRVAESIGIGLRLEPVRTVEEVPKAINTGSGTGASSVDSLPPGIPTSDGIPDISELSIPAAMRVIKAETSLVNVRGMLAAELAGRNRATLVNLLISCEARLVAAEAESDDVDDDGNVD